MRAFRSARRSANTYAVHHTQELSGPLSCRLRINIVSDLTTETGAEYARLVTRTVKEHVDLPSPSKIGLESVPLWRITFQFDTLSARHCIADLHASIAKYLGIEDPVTALKLNVAITNLHLQISITAADTTLTIGWNLQNQRSVENR